MSKQAAKKSGKTLLLGVLTVLAGFLCLLCPFISGISVAILVGSLILMGGVFMLVSAFSAGRFGKGIFAFLGGLLTIICGVVMLGNPAVTLVTLTLILAGYFVLEGISQIMLAFKVKPAKGWGWILFNGGLAVVLGFFIWRQWPISGVWAVGTLAGIHLISRGFQILALGSLNQNQPSIEVTADKEV